MDCQAYVIKKPKTLYNHVTFCVKCADGFYEFGFFGLGKFNDQKLDVSVDKYQSQPEGVPVDVGKCKKSLKDLIEHARGFPDKKYNVATNNCGHFTEYMCKFAGVSYPAFAVLN